VNSGVTHCKARISPIEQVIARLRRMAEGHKSSCVLLVLFEQGVARMVATHGQAQIPHALPTHLTTEAGMFGGFPAGSARQDLPH